LPPIHFSQIRLAFSNNGRAANVYGRRLKAGTLLMNLQINIDTTDRPDYGQDSGPRVTNDDVPVKLRPGLEVQLEVDLSLWAEQLRSQRSERRQLRVVYLQMRGRVCPMNTAIVSPEYPDVATAYHHVDAACIYFVQDPGRYDVVVTDNLFGDILTDLGGAISGGIGRAASANLNPARTGPSIFEPVHGSAPDIVGTGKADPRAAIMSAAMMLEHLGETDAALRVRSAVDKSDDVTGTTVEIGDAIAARV